VTLLTLHSYSYTYSLLDATRSKAPARPSTAVGGGRSGGGGSGSSSAAEEGGGDGERAEAGEPTDEALRSLRARALALQV
jgi:hypothetical protein